MVNFEPLRPLFLELYSASHASLPCLGGLPSVVAGLERSWNGESPTQPPVAPTLLYSLAHLEDQLKVRAACRLRGGCVQAARRCKGGCMLPVARMHVLGAVRLLPSACPPPHLNPDFTHPTPHTPHTPHLPNPGRLPAGDGGQVQRRAHALQPHAAHHPAHGGGEPQGGGRGQGAGGHLQGVPHRAALRAEAQGDQGARMALWVDGVGCWLAVRTAVIVVFMFS